MKAPEKIYLQQFDEDTIICLNEWNISEEWTDKPCNKKIATNIEYTRTDAFIEKATKWLKENAANFVSKDNEGEPYLYRIGLADEFIKAMML